jgi:pantetheine-phosphate adenylyltransferase
VRDRGSAERRGAGGRHTGIRRVAATSARTPSGPPVKRVAVYPGSFDPITNGHADLVRRSLQVFDRVIVAVAFNPEKDAAWFTPEERVEMIRAAFRAEGDRIEADKFSGLLVHYALSKGANVIVRGLRAVADFEYEFQMTMMNRHLTPEIETIFMMTGESHFYTSSRLVKEVVGLGGDVAGLVPDVVLPRLLERARRVRR